MLVPSSRALKTIAVPIRILLSFHLPFVPDSLLRVFFFFILIFQIPYFYLSKKKPCLVKNFTIIYNVQHFLNFKQLILEVIKQFGFKLSPKSKIQLTYLLIYFNKQKNNITFLDK